MKDKIIEEMARCIRPVLKNRVDIGFIPDLDKPIAEELIKQGYYKHPEDFITVSEFEYKDLKYRLNRAMQYNSLLQKEIDEVKEELSTCVEIKNQSRKETAKEILKKISDIQTENWGYIDWLEGGFFGDEFQNLCQKHGLQAIQTEDGVEVEER